MSPKARKAFDDEPSPRKTPLEGVPVPPAGSGAQTPAVPPAVSGSAPAASAPAPKRITSLIYKPPASATQPAVSSPLLEQLAAQKSTQPAPVTPEAPPAFLRAAVGIVQMATEAADEPRCTTITTTAEAELGATFIAGRLKLQVHHFPAPQAKRRIVIVNEVPGVQPNFDLAQALWLAGDEVAILHNRGESGSDGHFSLKCIERDIRQAIQPTVETGHRDRLWRSGGPALLIGSGLCAPSVLGIASEDERLAGVALIDPYVEIPTVLNLGESPIKPQDLYNHMLSGVVNMVGREALNEEWDFLAQVRNPMEMALKGGLDHMPILHVTSDRSVLAPMGKRFSAAMRQRNTKLYQHAHLPGSLPQFWRQRQELIDAIVFWVSQLS